MHDTKRELLERNGCKCMLCGKEVEYKNINWHHIKPKYLCKFFGEPIDDSYENGSLVCLVCHAKIHSYNYWDKEYQDMMDIIRSNKK